MTQVLSGTLARQCHRREAGASGSGAELVHDEVGVIQYIKSVDFPGHLVESAWLVAM